MNEHVNPEFDLDGLHERLHRLRAEIEGVAAALVAGVDRTKAHIKEAGGAAHAFTDQAHVAEEALEGAVRARPLVMILIAAAIGFVIGSLVQR